MAFRTGRLLFPVAAMVFAANPVCAATWTVLGWSEYGVNSMERSYSVFGIWPPSVTLHAQVIDNNGLLVKSSSSVKVTFEALADASGSTNTTSAGKTDFWTYAKALFGVSGTTDTGITGTSMPATGPQPMQFEAAYNRFTATSIPITPYDDNWNLNYTPLMKVSVRDASGNLLASARVAVPISNEVECRGCHASGVNTDARPGTGYAYDSDPNRDFKLNILSMHDFKNKRNPLYASSLATAGYSADGLLATATAGTPVLCSKCHQSNLFGAPGISGISVLTTAMHGHHAPLNDPKTNDTLDNSTNRTACYNCHPGVQTHGLRGVMGRSVGPDGSQQIQCQSCHGNLTALANPARRAYQDLPNCQACHTTSAPYQATSAVDASGKLHTTTDTTFATTANVPVAGASLYSASTGHGGLQCAACHGATHAEAESAVTNDNLQSQDLQGAAGVIGDCTACHKNGVSSATGGPHGMHNVGANWVSQHPDQVRNRAACAVCHDSSYQGSVLSRSWLSRNLNNRYANIQTFRGYQIGCYTCHNGPSGSGNPPAAPSVSATISGSALSGQPVSIPVTVSGNGTLRVVAQPKGGTAHLSGNTVIYQADPAFEGMDTFTYAATNPKDSNIGTGKIIVSAPSRAVFAPSGVSNTASYAPGQIAPGMITLFQGKGLGPANLQTFELNSGGFIEKALGSAKVLFDGVSAPIIYASDAALAAIVPYGVAGKSVSNVVVQYNGISSTPMSVPVTTSQPGIFTADASGKGAAAALNQDGTLNTATNPAKAGSVIVLYLTGDGVETPQPVDGKIVTTAPFPAAAAGSVTVSIGGKPAQMAYAGAAPYAVAGLMQVNAYIPADAPSGPATVMVTCNSIVSQAGVTIQVQ